MGYKILCNNPGNNACFDIDNFSFVINCGQAENY